MRRGWWPWAIIGGVLLLTVPFLLQRAALERANRTVELVVDLDSARHLGEQVSVPLNEILSRWAQRGVTSVAATDPEEIAAVEQVGLRVVPRTVEVLSALTERGVWGMSPVRAGPLISAGNAVAGFPDQLADVADLLSRSEIPFGTVEFAHQLGERELARLMNDVVVFVHSIPPAELARLTDRQALARFNRAVLERQARVLYIHPLPHGPSETLLARNEAYISAIVDRIESLGLLIGPVQPLPPWKSSVVIPVAVMVAAAAALLLVGRMFIHVRSRWEVLLIGVAAGWTGILVGLGHEVLARQAAALAVACVFPVLACAVPMSVSGASAFSSVISESDVSFVGTSPRPLFVDGMYRFAMSMLVTAVGAALVAAATADTRFFLKMEQFRGVKLAHLVPIGLMAAVWVRETMTSAGTRGPHSGSWRTTWRRLRQGIGWRHVVIGAAVVAVTFVFVARTGHHLLPVSAWERAAREALEQWLVVRPRTKEFLLGHPALVFAWLFFVRGRRDLGWPFLMVGMIASISVINTFAHAHVSLGVSITRSLYGMLLGLAVAVAALGVWSVWRRWGPPVQRGGPPVQPGGSPVQPSGSPVQPGDSLVQRGGPRQSVRISGARMRVG